MSRRSTFVCAILTGEQNAHSPYIRALLRTAETIGVTAYAVTPRQILSEQRNDELPHVVYNRIPTRKEEASLDTQRVKKWLKDQGIPYFNQRFFNKREMDSILRTDEELKTLLPDTLPVWEPEKVLQWLEEYEGIFVKPISGSFGEGICRASKVHGQYQLASRDVTRVHTLIFAKPQDCLDACRIRMRNMPFIVQEAIPLAKYEGCKTDFRVHIHRVTQDKWHVAAIGAKVAHPEGITTHVHSGGRVEDADRVLRSWYGAQMDHVRQEMEQTANRIGQKLAGTLDPQLGELGLDMGIAVDGRVVLFEANAKPGRSIFSHRSLRKAGSWSRIAVFQYARWLAEHNIAVGASR